MTTGAESGADTGLGGAWVVAHPPQQEMLQWNNAALAQGASAGHCSDRVIPRWMKAELTGTGRSSGSLVLGAKAL